MDVFIEKFMGALDNGTTVLDLGAGSGRQAAIFARAGHAVTAIDRQPRPDELAGVEWVTTDILEWVNTTGASMKCDGLFSRNVIQFFSAEFVRDELMPWLMRTLETNGVVAIGTFHEPPSPPFDKPFPSYWRVDELRQMFPDWELLHVDERTVISPDMQGITRRFFLSEIVVRRH